MIESGTAVRVQSGGVGIVVGEREDGTPRILMLKTTDESPRFYYDPIMELTKVKPVGRLIAAYEALQRFYRIASEVRE